MTTQISIWRRIPFKDLSILLLGVVLILSTRLVMSIERPEPKVFLMPPKDMKYFTLGYREIVADSMWLRVIQDFDVCDQNIAPIGNLVDHPAQAVTDLAEKKCHLGWVYQFIDSITELAPKFRIPYVSGGLMLSVMVHDVEGASRIFAKALKIFPNDWNILYYYGYHELSENNNNELAAKLLLEAAQKGAPAWVYSMAGNLFSKTGQAKFALSVLEDVVKKDPEGRWTAKLKARIEELQKAIAEQAENQPENNN